MTSNAYDIHVKCVLNLLTQYSVNQPWNYSRMNVLISSSVHKLHNIHLQIAVAKCDSNVIFHPDVSNDEVVQILDALYIKLGLVLA